MKVMDKREAELDPGQEQQVNVEGIEELVAEECWERRAGFSANW
jgi:hypothetical protein